MAVLFNHEPQDASAILVEDFRNDPDATVRALIAAQPDAKWHPELVKTLLDVFSKFRFPALCVRVSRARYLLG